MKNTIYFLASVTLLWHIAPALGFGTGEPAPDKAAELRRLDRNFQSRFELDMTSNYEIHAHHNYQQEIANGFCIPINIFVKEDFDTQVTLEQKRYRKDTFEKQKKRVARGAFVDLVDNDPRLPGWYFANLCVAAREVDVAYVKLLLEHGARSIERGEAHRKYDIFKTRNADIFRLLMQYGVITPEHFGTMEAEDRAFIEPIYNELKAEYARASKEVHKQYIAAKLSLAQGGLPNEITEQIFGFVADKPLAFEKMAHITGMLAVMQQLIKRMNFLGIHVIVDPLSKDPKKPTYKVIDENEVVSTISAQPAETASATERTTSSSGSSTLSMAGSTQPSVSSAATTGSEDDMKSGRSE